MRELKGDWWELEMEGGPVRESDAGCLEWEELGAVEWGEGVEEMEGWG